MKSATTHTPFSLRRMQTLAAMTTFVLIASLMGTAQTESVVYSFPGGSSNGLTPYSTPAYDTHLNWYVTTMGGGPTSHACPTSCGTVVKLNPTGTTETVLHVFKGAPSDGEYPRGSVFVHENGTVYGTTLAGGTANAGTVFMITPAGVESLVHSFTDTPDGAFPQAGLIRSANGSLYGTTNQGGALGKGTVFKITSDGTETIVHSFAGSPGDGQGPGAGLKQDVQGNLYGTANGGKFGAGVIFEITSDGTEKILYNFTGGADGANLKGSLQRGTQGNLYGVATNGGSTNCAAGCGTVFQLAPSGRLKVLYSFTGGSDGQNPNGELMLDAQGNFYGTTPGVIGTSNNGAVFKLTHTGVLTIVHSFAGWPGDGATPFGGLMRNNQGVAYGTTSAGGDSNLGTVYALTF